MLVMDSSYEPATRNSLMIFSYGDVAATEIHTFLIYYFFALAMN